MLLVVGSRVGLAVLQHGLQCQSVVDAPVAAQSLGEGIGDDHLGVRPTLRAAVAVATACIGQVALTAVDVQQRVHQLHLALRAEQRQQGRRRAVGVPDGVVVVVVGGILPSGVLAGLADGHQHGVVEGGVEHAPLLVAARQPNLLQQLLPGVAQAGQAGVEVLRVDVSPGLLAADVGDAHLHVDQRVGEAQHGVRRLATALGDLGRQHREGAVALQAEVDGIGIAVVPATADAAVAIHLVAAHHAQPGIDKLLALAQVGNAVLAQEVGGVEPQGGSSGRGVVEAVVGAALGGGNLGADAAFVDGAVVAQRHVLGHAKLLVALPRHRCSPLALPGEQRLQQDVSVFLSAARAADVGLREAADGLGHRGPSRVGQHPAVGAWLHHAERHRRPRERAAHAHAADAWVYAPPALRLCT